MVSKGELVRARAGQGDGGREVLIYKSCLRNLRNWIRFPSFLFGYLKY